MGLRHAARKTASRNDRAMLWKATLGAGVSQRPWSSILAAVRFFRPLRSEYEECFTLAGASDNRHDQIHLRPSDDSHLFGWKLLLDPAAFDRRQIERLAEQSHEAHQLARTRQRSHNIVVGRCGWHAKIALVRLADHQRNEQGMERSARA